MCVVKKAYDGAVDGQACAFPFEYEFQGASVSYDTCTDVNNGGKEIDIEVSRAEFEGSQFHRFPRGLLMLDLADWLATNVFVWFGLVRLAFGFCDMAPGAQE